MKKFLPYILILIILTGIFIPTASARAQEPTEETCRYKEDDAFGHKKGEPIAVGTNPPLTPKECGLNAGYYWGTAAAETAPPITAYQNCIDLGGTPESCAPLSGSPPKTQAQTDFEKAMASRSCVDWSGADIPWCFVIVSDLIFHTVPAFLLAKVAYFFNVLISISLDGDFLKQAFVSDAWGIVRDLSNIFFILILLYIALQIILDLGHDAKKMIVKVLIVALLINFSMFFTKVVIDSSNILALIFYNKISLTTKDASGNIVARPYDAIGKEKDIAGGMVHAFDPTIPLKKAFFDETAKIYYTDPVTGETRDTGQTGDIPAGTMIAIILITGLIMGFAIYALFISGISFLGRLLELWVLIIFSPFAFMSSTVHKLEHVDYLGWDSWLKRLINVSFMAPIFMFFLYFIFLLVGSNIFKKIVEPTPSITNDPAGATRMLLGVVMPAIFICLLLVKATDFAKKGSGKLGEAVTKFGAQVGGMATGLALGAATGGTAMVLRGTAGRLGAVVGNAGWTKKTGALGRGIGNIGQFAATRSFDLRKAPGAETLAKMGGINLGAAKSVGLGPKEGGFEKARKEKVEKRQKRAKELEVGHDEHLHHELSEAETDLQKLLNGVAKEFEEIDRKLESARKKKRDFKMGTPDYDAAVADITALRARKKDIATGVTGVTVTSGANMGKTIDELEQEVIPEKKIAIQTENRKRKWAYAHQISFFGGKANREAAHKIRMEQKLDSGDKGHH